MPVKVILVEDHEIVRQGIRSLIESEPDIEVVGEAANGQEALWLCNKLQPDLILMDMNMPVMNGSECTKALKKELPDIRVLILSMHDYESNLIDMFNAGADGYILKNSPKKDLLFAIRKVADGDIYISSEFTLSMMEKYKAGFIPGYHQSPIIPLSDGEVQVLDLIAQGLTNTQMANKLFISVRTIESRRKKLLEKTGTTNTATLIKYSIMNKLVR